MNVYIVLEGDTIKAVCGSQEGAEAVKKIDKLDNAMIRVYPVEEYEHFTPSFADWKITYNARTESP